jgi:farnesyl-diphosphate farnesyltransferase
MAILTLQKINRHRNFSAGQEVKISRRSVKGTIVVTNLTAGSDKLLKLLFSLTSKGLPVGAIHEKLSGTLNNARIQV